jgi:hypothetical protein
MRIPGGVVLAWTLATGLTTACYAQMQQGGGTASGGQGTGNTGNTGNTGGGSAGGSTGSSSFGNTSGGSGPSRTFDIMSGADGTSFSLPGMNIGSGGASSSTSGQGGANSRTGRRVTQGRGTTTTGAAGLNAIGRQTGTGRFGTSGSQLNRTQNRNRAQYVTQLDFAVPAAPPASNPQLQASIHASLTSIVPTGVSASWEGETVVLQGTVPTVENRRLAERMVLLEPGVRDVRNELVVSKNTSSQP